MPAHLVYDECGAVFGKSGVVYIDANTGALYRGLMVEIVRFFRIGVPPVTPAETLELLAFMQAADVSKERGGQPVLLSELPSRSRRSSSVD